MQDNHRDRADLLRDIRDQKSDALRRIYEEVFPMVKKHVVKNSGTVQDAWDVFQEAMMVLYKKSKMDDFQLTSKLSTFLMAVCKNLWLKKLKRTKVTLLTKEEESVLTTNPSIEEDLIEVRRKALFHRKLNLLNDQCRSILDLFFKRHKMEDIAKKMNLASAEVVRVVKHRCTKKLMSLIMEDSEYEELNYRA